MSLFGDLTSGGIRMPDTVFDQSAMLPPLNTAGYGAGYDGTPDARINKGSSLFSDMKPYAYGEGDRLSTQASYLANPHNIQKIVPQLRLPDSIFSSEHSNFTLPHSVTDGDVAFSIRFSAGDVRTEMMNNTSLFFKQGAGRAVDYICNISTINYIMRGLFTEAVFLNPAWRHFATALGFETEYETIQTYFKMLRLLRTTNKDLFDKKLIEVQNLFRVRAEHLVRDHFRPIGVVIGSEKQGGQHEVSQKTVTWPTAYIVTISIDGRNENLCNYWHHLDVSSGSELGFFVKLARKDTYALNYTKQITSRQFTNCNKNGLEQGPVSNLFPQLCPGMNEDRCLSNEVTGHWHFCMSQAMHHQTTTKESFNDITTMHVGALMLATISVVWMRTRIDEEEYNIHHGVLEDDPDLFFGGKECKEFMAEWRIAHQRSRNFNISSTAPTNAAHYLTTNMKKPISRIADGRIAITLSTTPTVPIRTAVTRPRLLTDDELKEIGQPPRTKARTQNQPPVKETKEIPTKPPATLGSKTPDTITGGSSRSKSKKGKTTEGHSF